MITADYCRVMARYNQWQNDGLRRIVADLPEAELTRDRGAFFGSIMATLNHLLWADKIWMSRLSDLPAPPGGIKQSVTLTPTRGDWDAARFRLDGQILDWADGLVSVDLLGDLAWYSGSFGREFSRKRGLCVAHFFNHQTHHRGQIHAMLTAAGVRPGDTDLIFMPD